MNLPEKPPFPTKDQLMRLALDLAAQGGRRVAPNPMVGAVLECGGEVIGQGYHEYFGGPHAEINAINAVRNPDLLPLSTLYVTLEPCSSRGKTPPCVEAILDARIPRVVIAARDPNPQNSMGVELLNEAGVSVATGLLGAESEELNKRFIVFQQKRRPYVILKWAESEDRFLGPVGKQQWITGEEAREHVHRWRSEESAIMVGTNTVAIDNPFLTVRAVKGENPTRIILDRTLRLARNSFVFDDSAKTLLFTEREPVEYQNNVEVIKTSFGTDLLPHLLSALYSRGILSVMVEGGEQLLNSFLESGIWDEARVFQSRTKLETGVRAPKFYGVPSFQETVGADQLSFYRNHAPRT